MNIFFNTSSEDTSLSKVAISHDIPNIQDHHSPDYFHYIDFTMPRLLNKATQIIDKKLLYGISLYSCNTITYDGHLHQSNDKILSRRMILKFSTLSNLLQFINNTELPIWHSHINSIRCIHNSLFSHIESIAASPRPSINDNDDLTEQPCVHSDEDSFNKIFNATISDNDLSPSPPSQRSNNNFAVFISTKDHHWDIINRYSCSVNTPSDTTSWVSLLQKIGHDQHMRRTSGEVYSYAYFADLYSKHSLFNKLKQDYLEHLIEAQRTLQRSQRIIKVKKPKIPYSSYDQYAVISSLGCMSYTFDSDDESTTSSELDISDQLDDNWNLEKLSSNSDTILTWLENDKKIAHYALSYDGDPILYFNDIEKAQKYLKYISAMLIEKLKVLHFPDYFRLTKIDGGYQIDKCIWDILFPIYIRFSKIILTPIFEIN